MSVVAAAGRRVGRFELLRELGRGAQATVWLGHDARLDREVAIKLLDPATDHAAVQAWMNEARAVSRLTHPNIVPVFEADDIDGQSTLVFEYVDGGTLAQARRGQGPMAPRAAVTLMVGVLDALATAHAQGIVHRDLKPSNLLLAPDGRARVMDFGIAARVAAGADGLIAGTPGYMSPEAARGEAPHPAMDVFAAGMVLGELLAGMPLLRERDPYRALARVQQEDFHIPDSVRVDDSLRGIVARAVARDARHRYDGAASFRDALAAWLEPEDAGAASAAGHGTLDFLLRRMKHKRDFPALGASIVRIQRVASSETESLDSLSAEILKDVSLTNKLLRMVNTVHFAHAGAGSISTISRAVALIGFAGVRNMALSVMLLEHMQDKGHAAQIKEEFLRALMGGTLASQLTPVRRAAEETFIGAMFQNLGRMLTEYYFPEEAQQIRQLAPTGAAAGRAQAAVKVLGLSYQDLALGVARSWGLPDSLQRMMQTPDGDPPGRLLTPESERQRWVGRIANEITEQMMREAPESVDVRIGRLAEGYAPALGLSPRSVLQAAEAARSHLAALAEALGIQVGQDAPAHRLLAAQQAKTPDSLALHALTATAALDEAPTVRVAPGAPTPAAPTPAAVSELLAAGVQDITNCMVADNFRLNEVLRMVLETMYRALGFRQVVFCLRDPRTESLTARFGLGDGVDERLSAFQIPLRPPGPPDLFSAVCAKGVDTLIADATTPAMAKRLPAWFHARLRAPTFLLLPLSLRGACFGLIYADKTTAGAIEVDEKGLSLLRTLRNQAVMAFRQLDRG